jgi:YVTN family beta-propeller protein
VTNYSAGRCIDTGLIDKVSAIDSSTNKITDTVSVGRIPQAIEYNPKNNQIYVAKTFSDTVSVMKPKAHNNKLISSINVSIQPGNGSAGLAYNSNDGMINVTNLNANTVSIVS